VQEARRLQIPVIPRGEMLAELMRLKYGIAVAGSHGKTTTTSMTATILNHAGLDPTVVVGGRVGTMGGSNARVGNSDFLVAESDESDGSFLKLAPIIAVVTNIDREHLDHYPSLEAIQAAFIEFVNKVPFYGAVIVCLDDPTCRAFCLCHQAADGDLRRHGAGRCGGQRDRLRAFRERFPAALPHGGSGPVPPARSRPAQRAERHGGGGGGDGAGSSPGGDPGGAGGVQRRGPAVPGARQGARHHGGRRLRPPSHRDPRHARERPAVRLPAHPRVVSAAPVHADVSPDGRVRARVPPGR
jgi:hypothetical protein